MAKEKQSTFDERITWKEGDVQVFGPDGKEISLEEQKKKHAEVEKGPPTVNIYLPDEADEK
jgi:hypothetical protein